MYLIISDNQKQLWWCGDIQMNVNKISKYPPTYPIKSIHMSRQTFHLLTLCYKLQKLL